MNTHMITYKYHYNKIHSGLHYSVEGIYTARSPAAHYFWAEGGKAYVAADGIIANKVRLHLYPVL